MVVRLNDALVSSSSSDVVVDKKMRCEQQPATITYQKS